MGVLDMWVDENISTQSKVETVLLVDYKHVLHNARHRKVVTLDSMVIDPIAVILESYGLYNANRILIVTDTRPYAREMSDEFYKADRSSMEPEELDMFNKAQTIVSTFFMIGNHKACYLLTRIFNRLRIFFRQTVEISWTMKQCFFRSADDTKRSRGHLSTGRFAARLREVFVIGIMRLLKITYATAFAWPLG